MYPNPSTRELLYFRRLGEYNTFVPIPQISARSLQAKKSIFSDKYR
jgi:hypothetical protein